MRGRKAGRHCVAPGRANTGKPRCTRYLALRGRFTRAGQAFANSFHFTGRVHGHALKPGRYTLRATATLGTASSKPKTTGFRIKKNPHKRH